MIGSPRYSRIYREKYNVNIVFMHSSSIQMIKANKAIKTVILSMDKAIKLDDSHAGRFLRCLAASSPANLIAQV